MEEGRRSGQCPASVRLLSVQGETYEQKKRKPPSPETFSIVRDALQDLVDRRIVKGHITGPKNNVLMCDTPADFVLAGSEMTRRGFDTVSPGYLGSHPVSRQTTHSRIWKSGSLCAIQVVKEPRLTLFFHPQGRADQPVLCVLTTVRKN